jgi:purine-nucleoside phosphorylase
MTSGSSAPALDELAQAQAYVSSTALRDAGRAPRIGVVLGSGLGAFGDSLSDLVKLPYSGIPHMPRSSVIGHAGYLCLGRVGGVPVACLQGRVHLYEGHPVQRVVFGVRLLAELGCHSVLLTNAAGGIGSDLLPGDLMLIRDHLNLTSKNPLIGPNDPRGPRFPDMTRAYSEELTRAAKQAADELGLTLREGVYAGLLGPTYETPAEVAMLRILGAHAVGMSTVNEVIALRHRGVHVGAVSCITNLAAGLADRVLDHAEVEATANATRERFVQLLERWIQHADAALGVPS